MSLNTTFCQKSYHCFVITAVITQNCSCVFDFTFLMSSSVWISGESPPCTHRNCWFIRAARGRQSNASMQESYTCSEYLILPAGWGSRQTFQDLKQRKRLSVFWHALNSHHCYKCTVGPCHWETDARRTNRPLHGQKLVIWRLQTESV